MLFFISFKVFFLLPLTVFTAPLLAVPTTIPGATYNLTLVGKTGGAVSSNPNDGDTVFLEVSLREQSPDSVTYDVKDGWKTNKEDTAVPATALFLSPYSYGVRVNGAVSDLLAYGQDQEDSTYWFIYPDPQREQTGEGKKELVEANS